MTTDHNFTSTLTDRIEWATWILIYGGLFGIVFGMALMSRMPAAAWTLIVVGAVGTVVGGVLVWVRSRRPD